MKYKYKFSIVTAVYNTEKYIEEMILSIINQTIGFEENVQLVLVNDGSEDQSREICIKYRNMFPKNIIYLDKEHRGVSSARNLGLEHVEGKYLNFLDSDDKLEEKVLYKVYEFFEKNYKEIDLVAIPLYFFDNEIGEHILNYKFHKTRVINILEEYYSIQLSGASIFAKKKFVLKYKFNEKLKYAEDAELISKIILNKCAFGVLHDAKYWYRRREDKSSAIQRGSSRKEWYLDYLEEFSNGIINYSLEKKGVNLMYIQYLVMYDLQYRFTVGNLKKSPLTKEEQKQYIKLIIDILKFIDNKIIFKQRCIKIHHKLFIIILKNLDNQFLKKAIIKLLWYRKIYKKE